MVRAVGVVLVLWSALALAGWTSPDGEKLEDTEYRKSSGPLISWLVLVADAEKLYTDWEKPAKFFHAEETETVARNAEINAFVVFGGCEADASGNCNVTVQFKVTAPDGSVYADSPKMEGWVGRPAPPVDALQLCVDYLKAVLEPGEQLGSYRVVATVVDQNSGRKLSISRTFTAKETGD